MKKSTSTIILLLDYSVMLGLYLFKSSLDALKRKTLKLHAKESVIWQLASFLLENI